MKNCCEDWTIREKSYQKQQNHWQAWSHSSCKSLEWYLVDGLPCDPHINWTRNNSKLQEQLSQDHAECRPYQHEVVRIILDPIIQICAPLETACRTKYFFLWCRAHWSLPRALMSQCSWCYIACGRKKWQEISWSCFRNELFRAPDTPVDWACQIVIA